jgi:hypothetical protein
MLSNDIVIVSGLPRSGTSMMMRMISGGGIEALTDQVRTADPDNPHGYFEFEPVKATRQDASWVPSAQGKVVKLVHILLRDLPDAYRYRVVMMDRDLDEVIASQVKMLERSGKRGGQLAPDALKRVFASQLGAVREWMDARPNFARLDVRYDRVVADARGEARRVAAFLGIPEAADRMAAAVDPALYRNRRAPGG